MMMMRLALVRWIDEGIPQILENWIKHTGDNYHTPYGISATGDVIVGGGSGTAWRWTEESGMRDLPRLTPRTSEYQCLRRIQRRPLDSRLNLGTKL